MEYYFRLEGDENADLDRDNLEEVIDGDLRTQHRELWETLDRTESLDSNFLGYQESDAKNTILTLLGEKRGTMPVGGRRVPDMEAVSSYAEAVQSMGGDVYVRDSLIRNDNVEIHQPRIFVTRDRSFRDSEIPVFNGDDIEIGRSLGYPEEEVIAFSENGFWPEGIEYTEDRQMVPANYRSGTNYLFKPDMLARETGLNDYEQELGLINHGIRDTEESLERAIQTGKRYRKALEGLEMQYDLEIL